MLSRWLLFWCLPTAGLILLGLFRGEPPAAGRAFLWACLGGTVTLALVTIAAPRGSPQ